MSIALQHVLAPARLTLAVPRSLLRHRIAVQPRTPAVFYFSLFHQRYSRRSDVVVVESGRELDHWVNGMRTVVAAADSAVLPSNLTTSCNHD